MVLFPPLHVGCSLGFASESGLEYLGLPCEGQVWRWCSCLGHRGSVSTWYSEELMARAAGNIMLQKGMSTSCWPTNSSILAWRNPLPEKPGRPWSSGLQRVGHNRRDPGCVGARL